MNHSIGQIGYFQLSNLVRNKVPFALFALDFKIPQINELDVKQIFKSVIETDSQSLLGLIQEMKLKLDHPIILICPQGGVSSQFALKMSEHSFINIYYVKNGWDGLAAEAEINLSL